MSESKENCFQDSWRKPAKSIKLVVKKRVRKTDDKSSRILKTRNANTDQVEAQTAGKLKRHNPFGCSASKKANLESSLSNEENVKFFSALDQPVSTRNMCLEKTSSCSATLIVLNEESINARISREGSHNSSKNIDDSCEDDDKVSLKHLSGKNLPSDWSLKTRVRFTSSQPFHWCSKMLGKQEAQGLCNFVRCQVLHSKETSTCFQQNIMYWVHPTLPWISLFPRLSSDIKLTSKVPNIAENQDITIALQASWSQSFRSLFNLLRCGYCEYFYLCSAQFTVMFRAAMTGDLSSTSAYVTPTTKGIREGFDKEGISYTLPVLDETKDTSSYESDDEYAEINPLKNDDDEDDACWLESMGVGKETLPQLQQSKVNQQRVKLRNIDHQSSSLAIITGSHTQALFNFLLNCKTLISKTGSHAGIPPTLLAPVAFDGATLQSLTAKHGMIKQGKNLEQRYSLDISGPILPGNLTKLCQLFESTQHHYSAAMKNLQATAPFNVLSPNLHVQEQFNDENVLGQPSNLGTTSLTFIKYEDTLYSWETS